MGTAETLAVGGRSQGQQRPTLPSTIAPEKRTSFTTIAMCMPPRVPVPKPGPCPGPRKPKVAALLKPKKKAKTDKPKAAAAKTTAKPPKGNRNLAATLDWADIAQKTTSSKGTGVDRGFEVIADQQGFRGLPRLGSSTDLDALKAAGGVELFKGFPEGAAAAVAFRTSPSGGYTSTAAGTGIAVVASKTRAAKRGNGAASSVQRMVLHPDARVVDAEDLTELHEPALQRKWTKRQNELLRALQADGTTEAQWERAYSAYVRWRQEQPQREAALQDPGKLATALGFDAIRTPNVLGDDYLVLNRAAVMAHDPTRDVPVTGRSAPAAADANPTIYEQAGRKRDAGTDVTNRIVGVDLTELPDGQVDFRNIMNRQQRSPLAVEERLTEIARIQGFDGLPTVASKDEVDELVKSGAVQMFRGVKTYVQPDGKVRSAADLAEQYRSGTAHYGRGVYGDGIYAGEHYETAANYAKGDEGAITRMVVKPGAKVIEYEALRDMMREEAPASVWGKVTRIEDLEGDLLNASDQATLNRVRQEIADIKSSMTPKALLFLSSSAYAMAKGYDLVEVDPARSRRSNPEAERYYVILNRTATVVQERQSRKRT